jgi:formate dehydrogenase major subunit
LSSPACWAAERALHAKVVRNRCATTGSRRACPVRHRRLPAESPESCDPCGATATSPQPVGRPTGFACSFDEPDRVSGGRVPGVKTWLDSWPVYRQLTGSDPLGRGKAARSKATEAVVSRTATADRVVKSVCPYCAVGCAQDVYVKDEKIVQIEGNPDSPVNRGRLCPKGSASKQLVTSPTRVTKVRYRRPYGTEWEDLELDQAMEMIADEQGRPLRRTMGIASLGGATLDNEENYLMKKLYSAMGAIQIENQARI